ncbi:MAG TPA: MBL fold metallo-hydrolase, partial [Woeseiaceae bacterium]|nr:MBL fold metallo-hydrolase [Woeseiaceae bacterium]
MYRFALPSILLGLAAAGTVAAGDSPTIVSEEGQVTVHPVEHASFVLEAGDTRIALDPVGGGDAFEGVDLALVTDIHGDHFDGEMLQGLAADGASIVAPAAVVERMEPQLARHATVLGNGERTTISGVTIEAIPMYNLSESPRHPKGRGNGYVLEV